VLDALDVLGTDSGYESKNLEITHMKDRVLWTDKLKTISDQIT
jgi:hypothetical protein